MGKRFVDTALGRKAWFRRLPPKLKCAWRFLTDECDSIGLWSIDLDSLEFHVGERVTVEEMLEGFNSDESTRLAVFQHDKLFLTGFIDFQYGTLSTECNAHIPVIKRLKSLRLFEGYLKGSITLMDKEEDKEEETDKEKEEEEEKEKRASFDFESAYRRFPRKEGKSKGLKKLKSEIKTPEDFEKLIQAIENYAMSRRGQDPQFSKHFSTFASEWRDWIDFSPGTLPAPTPQTPAYRRMAGNQQALSEALAALEARDEQAG